jgi:hypothetical protein
MLAGNRVEQARLADPVAPQNAGHLAWLGGKSDAAERLRGAVVEIDSVDPQHAQRPR